MLPLDSELKPAMTKMSLSRYFGMKSNRRRVDDWIDVQLKVGPPGGCTFDI